MIAALDRPLSTVLRDCTAIAHSHSEKSPFMSCLTSGALNSAAVADYTAQLWFIYVALEDGVREHSAGSRLGVFADSRLERVQALEQDLLGLIGPRWRDCVLPGRGTLAYVAHLRRLAKVGDETGLIAHHYVRYLGDLSGGQVLARVLRERYRIGPDGLNFYDFSRIGSRECYRSDYRCRLDLLELDEVDLSWLVSSANEAFEFTRGVLGDLAERHCVFSNRI